MTHNSSYSKTLANMHFLQKGLLLVASIVTLCLIGILLTAGPTFAAHKNDWQYENIIDDSIFTDANSMSVQDIQNFLDSSVGACDTWGTGEATEFHYTGFRGTRAEYAASRGWPGPPYTCLNLYYEVPKTSPVGGTPANNYTNPSSIPPGAQSAAWIIKDAANRYNISPKVLLVKIATESAGPLTSDKWPLFSQYRYAMGAQCPDSGPNGSANCNSNYAGFSIQVYEAAALMRSYLDNMEQDWWPYKRVGSGRIRPDGSNSNWVGWNVAPRNCGGTVINIQTKATAALYTYTPYQPNQAALDNLYGTGDYCSAYGNRNFWRVFYDWFGSTRGRDLIEQNILLDQPLQVTPSSGGGSDPHYTASFRIKNTSSSAINLGFMFVSVRDIYGNNLDFPAKDIVIKPNSTYTYSASRTFPKVGKLKAYIGGKLNQIGWTYDVPRAATESISREVTFQSGTDIADLINNQVALTEPLRISPTSSADPNQVYTATFSIKNTSNARINLGFMFVSVRDANNANLDFPARDIVLEPNATYTYKSSRTFPKSGKLRTYIGGFFTQIGWDYNLPKAKNENLTRSRSIIPNSDVVLSGDGISITNEGEGTYRARATFKNLSDSSRNVGWFLVSARTPSGENVDFPMQNIIIPPKGTVSYNQVRTFDLSEKGKFTFFANLHDPIDGYGWTTTYPASETSKAKRETSFLNGPSVIQTKEIEAIPLSDGSIRATVEFTNYGTQDEYMGWVILSTRLSGSNTNYDFPPQEVTIKAGETKKLTYEKRFIKGGSYSTVPVFYKWPNSWSHTYAPLQKEGMNRSIGFESAFSMEQVGDISFSRTGNNTTASITIRNTTANRLEAGSIVVSVRDRDNNNLDFPIMWGVLEPNQTKTFKTSRPLPPGQYHITLTAHHYEYGWGPSFKVNTNRDFTFQ